MKVATLALTTAFVVSGALGASAHSVKPVEKRQAIQSERIEDGRRDGSITWLEGKKLRKEQREIQALKNDFLDDGHLTKRESRVLKWKQKEASANIYTEKHDGRRRLWWLPRVGR